GDAELAHGLTRAFAVDELRQPGQPEHRSQPDPHDQEHSPHRYSSPPGTTPSRSSSSASTIRSKGMPARRYASSTSVDDAAANTQNAASSSGTKVEWRKRIRASARAISSADAR